MNVNEHQRRRVWMKVALLPSLWILTHMLTLIEWAVNLDNAFEHFILYIPFAASRRSLVTWPSLMYLKILSFFYSLKSAIGLLLLTSKSFTLITTLFDASIKQNLEFDWLLAKLSFWPLSLFFWKRQVSSTKAGLVSNLIFI